MKLSENFNDLVEPRIIVNDINNFNEALEHLQPGMIAIVDIDGTTLAFKDTLFRIVINYFEGMPFGHTLLTTFKSNKLINDLLINRLKFKTKEQLIEHFSVIKSTVWEKTGVEPIFVTNRIAFESWDKYSLAQKPIGFLHELFDNLWGTSHLIAILREAGIADINFGMDRQTSGIFSINGSWDKFISQIEKRISYLSNRQVTLVLIADNLNLIGPIANERRFLCTAINKLKQNNKLHSFQTYHFNVKKFFPKNKYIFSLELFKTISTNIGSIFQREH